MRSITVLALVPALASAACPLAAQSASRPAVSLVASNFSVGGLPPPLYFRHAGFQGWATPDETNLDDLDSSFVLSPGLVTGDPSGTVSFQNADEYPGYFIVVSEAVDNRVILSPADGSAFFNATASWYPRDAPGPDGACLLESFAVPGLFMTATVPPADGRAPTDTPCHYASCAPVFALPPNASLAAGAVWLPVPANSGPGSNATDGPFTVGGITFTLRNATQTIAGLSAAGDADAFEWLPSDTGRIGPGFQHLGDATLRLRPAAADPATPWTQVATGAAPSHARAVPVPPSLPGGLIAADVTPLLAAGAPGGAASLLGLRVVREYGTANASSGGLALSFILSNTNATSALELGAFGASLPFDNDWTGLSLEQNAATCSLADPYIGLDAGYVRVTRISGRGPVILVTPLPRAESDCAVAGVPAAGGCIGRLEAWRKLTEDPAPRSVSFEGFYEWQPLSLAWATQEWAAAEPWNEPTSLVLPPGASAVVSLRISAALPPPGQSSAVRSIPSSLRSLGLATLRGAPGFVLTPAMRTAGLVVTPPAGATLSGAVEVSPAGALVFGAAAPSPNGGTDVWLPVAVGTAGGGAAHYVGRARATLLFSDGSVASAHFFCTAALPSLLASLRSFLGSRAWFDDQADPFGRAFSYMDFDAQADWPAMQDPRVYAVGLSDEAGAGSGLAMAVALGAGGDAAGPDPVQVAQLATYVNRTLWGTKLDGTGVPVSLQGADGGVRASLFYAGQPGFKYNVSGCWDRQRAETTWRSYNYPHPTMIYYNLYALARNAPGLGRAVATAAAASPSSLSPLAPWQFYLDRALNTTLAMWNLTGGLGGYAQYGLMVGSGFGLVMDAAAAEGAADPASPFAWSERAAAIEAILRARVALWASLPFPFGSEMPWDSTGQEEIETWSARFGAYACANATLDSVLAYTPAVAHWAYHGASRRYFDFGVNGKIVIDATERALHHYGSGINAVVTLGAFVRLPNDTALLELGHGATMGTLTTVNASSGVIAMAWHGDASLLIPDPYAADAGVNIYGSSRGWGCYVVDDADWGLLGYGCDVTPSASSAAASDIAPRRIHADASAGPVDVVPTDPLRRSLYIAPIGLLLRADTLPILNATVDLRRSGGAPSLTLRFDTSGGAAACPGLYAAARLEVSLPVVADLATVADVAWVSPQPAPPLVRGAYELPCDAGSAVLTWTWLPGPASHD